MTLMSDVKFEKKLALGCKNDITNLVNCNTSTGKSENLHFDVLLLSIAYRVLAKKVQKSYLSWRWRVIQILKKNSLFVWKITWIIWWILTRAVENLKIFTLMRHFFQKYVMFELNKWRQVVLSCMVSKMTQEIWWVFAVVEGNVR